MTKGIDVSVWQGNIDWSKASKEIDFAILRAGYGSTIAQKDKKFEQNFSGCKKNNVKVGVYWYNYAKTIAGAKQEAQACIEALKNKKLDFPVWYDIEENSVFATGKANVSAIAKTFCDIVAAAGYKVGIYSGKYAFQTYFTNEVKNKYDIWLANVGKNGAALSKTTYNGKYDMWQYSWKGRISGIIGDVDMDYCYKDYQNQSINSVKENKEIINKNVNTIDVIYRVSVDGKNWYPEVKNTDNYAGLDGKPIIGFTGMTNKGLLRFRVHNKNGRWLGWISKYNWNDWNYGVAGLKGKAIDGIQMDFSGVPGYQVSYRVSTIGTSGWYPWVTGYGSGSNGYAGVYGKLIDKIQVKIVKI